MRGYVDRNDQEISKNCIIQTLALLSKSTFVTATIVLMISLGGAQVEFRDSNSFQFFSDIEMEEGDILMSSNRIVGLPEPESSGEPVTRGFAGEGFVEREGDSMDGDIEMQGNDILMEEGEIGGVSQLEVADISGINFIMPDSELQITDDISLSGNNIRDIGSIEDRSEFLDLAIFSEGLRSIKPQKIRLDEYKDLSFPFEGHLYLTSDDSNTRLVLGQDSGDTWIQSHTQTDNPRSLHLNPGGGNVEVGDDLEVEGDVDVGGGAVNARNIRGGSGASMYFQDSSNNDVLRMRGGDGRFYNDIIVGEATDSPDATLDVRGDARFEDNIDMDGSDITNLDFIGASGNLQIGGDVDMLGGDISNAGTGEFDGLNLGGDGAIYDSSGTAADYYQDHNVGPVSSNTRHAILLHESDAEKTMGQLEMLRYSSSRGRYLGNMNIIAQTERRSNDPEEDTSNVGRTRFAIEANEVRSTTPWEIGYAEYEGTEYVVLVYTTGNNEYTQNAKFNGYNSDGGPELIQYYDESTDECLEQDICDTINKADISEASNEIDRLTIGGSRKEFYQSDVVVHQDFEAFGSKDFVHPFNDTHEAVYTAQESDDVRAVVEESAQIPKSGEKVVELPYHFSEVLSNNKPDLKVQLTPHEFIEGSLGVTQRNKTHFTVQGPQNQTTKFDYRITGIRDGFEDKETVRRRR